MPATERSQRRWFRAAVWLVLLTILWMGTAVLARDVRPWAIRLTTICFALCLVASYALIWAIALDLSQASRRRMQLRAVAVSFVLLIAWIIFELPALIGVVDYARVLNIATGDWSGPASNFVADMQLGYRHPTHSTWAGRPRSDMAVNWNLPIRSAVPMQFTTDARGFRNLRDLDRADIVLVGDSYVEGAYVSDDETCAVWLERLTGQTVANLGHAGYGTLQELEVLTHYALPLQPKFVAWFFFEGNDLYNDEDFEQSIGFLREHGTYEPEGSRWKWAEFRDRSFTRTAFLAIRRVADRAVPNNVATFGWFRDERGNDWRMYFYDYATLDFDAYEQQRFESTKASFQQGRDRCAEQGAKLVVFYIPMKFRVYGDLCRFPPASPCREWQPWNLAAEFRRFCDEAQIDFVDLTISMREAAKQGKLLYAPEDSHWNQAGHQFVSERLREEWVRLSGG